MFAVFGLMFITCERPYLGIFVVTILIALK